VLKLGLLPQNKMLLAISIFALTLVLVMTRPKPFNETAAASLGALFMVLGGVVTPPQILSVLQVNLNVLLFFLGLMVVSAVAEKAGFFRWSALGAVKAAKGSGTRLLLFIIGLGVVITAFFSNDATALVLTPIVYVLVTKLRLNPLPYVFACAFIANAASVILPVSNPVNLLAVDRFGLTLPEYLKFLLVPALLAVLVNVVFLLIFFRKEASSRFMAHDMEEPFKVDGFFLFVCSGLALTAAAYLVSSLYGLPLSLAATGGAVFLLIGSFAARRVKFDEVVYKVSWSIFPFIFSLAVLVRGLENVGVTRALGEYLAAFASNGNFTAIILTTFGNALGSNLINNWSMMMVSVTSVGSISDPSEFTRHGLIYSTILGNDLGPNLTIFGSLSSMLWLLILRRNGIFITPGQFLKLGLLVTPPMLFLGALAVYITGLL